MTRIAAFEGRLDPAIPPAWTRGRANADETVCEAVTLTSRRTRTAHGAWVPDEPIRRIIRATGHHAETVMALAPGASLYVIGRVISETISDHNLGSITQDYIVVESVGAGLLLPRADEGEHVNIVAPKWDE